MIRCKLLLCVLKVSDNREFSFMLIMLSKLKCKIFVFIIHKKSLEMLKQVLMSADDGTLSLFVKNSTTVSLILLVYKKKKLILSN